MKKINQNTYGLSYLPHALQLATQVSNVLGNGKHNNAVAMLLETACAETLLGTYQDPTPNGAGWGLTQADNIAVVDVAHRTRQRDRALILQHFGYDIRQMIASELGQDPLKAFVFTRCFYKLIPAEFPKTLEGRANYWKRHYNTFHENAKGTPSGYIKKATLHLYSGQFTDINGGAHGFNY